MSFLNRTSIDVPYVPCECKSHKQYLANLRLGEKAILDKLREVGSMDSEELVELIYRDGVISKKFLRFAVVSLLRDRKIVHIKDSRLAIGQGSKIL